jgi:hypothetical protein
MSRVRILTCLNIPTTKRPFMAQVPIFVNQTICHQDSRCRAIDWNTSNQHLVDD